MRNVFQPRKAYKPFEYPEVQTLIDAMNQTYWIQSEIDFIGDIQDFKTKLSPIEQDIFKRAALSIAQVECDVKTFWGDLYRHFPKPEFNDLGITFAESEVRHASGYSKLLEVMGFEKEFENLYNIPIFQQKLDLIKQCLKGEELDIIQKLFFFTIVIENSSLFSQFAIILSFTRFKGLMKNTSNIINWSATEEDLHKDGGVMMLEFIRESSPERYQKIINSVIQDIHKYVQYEEHLLDWIFEKGNLDTISKTNLLNFMKHRIDLVLERLQLPKQFNISNQNYQPMYWFDQETLASKQTDFFSQRPVDYTKFNQSYSGDSLF